MPAEPGGTFAEPGGTPAAPGGAPAESEGALAESGRGGEPRGANLRMVALASVVALAVVLPLAAATAGPAGLPGPEAARGERPGKHPGAADGGLRGESAGLGRPGGPGGPGGPGKDLGKDLGRGLGKDLGRGLGPDLREDQGAWPAASPPLMGPAGSAVSASARCGPELTSPEGVEAQTCVLEQRNETWARTYYRNATGAPLRAVLTLMGPDGRTVQVQCRTTASDDPDGCETPRARTVRTIRAEGEGAAGDEPGGDPYEAVAEIATADGKLLLRSGSNSAEERGD
ncbi:hypothetical protein [Streptomyces hiroshimensis]|uniref:Collagen-like protein n=1 Tax=Streptomyces hiroshimensis TaxID=66424 RepID=A0ABQ2YSK5_9ACTN|nr:hypothetical protein [Streptomyces hiroshimensis]GGX92828.1 hypothetical protein GCM10010324_43420 [Streptomyces hiroshimensis]